MKKIMILLVLFKLFVSCKEEITNKNDSSTNEDKNQHECFKTGLGCSELDLDAFKAKEAFAIGCSKRDMDSCLRLGQYLEVKEKDYKGAREYYKRVCKEGDKYGCEAISTLEVTLQELKEEKKKSEGLKPLKTDLKISGFTKIGKKVIYHFVMGKCVYKNQKIEIYLGHENKIADEEFKEFGYPYLIIKQGDKVSYKKRKYQSLKFYNPTMNINCEENDKNIKTLFFYENNRPSRDYTVAFVYDALKKNIVNQKVFKKLLFNYNQGYFVDETYASDFTEKYLKLAGKSVKLKPNTFSAFYTIENVKGMLKAKPLVQLTFDKFPVRGIFKTISDFNKHFGYDGQNYTKQWYYVFNIDGHVCLKALERREDPLTIDMLVCAK